MCTTVRVARDSVRTAGRHTRQLKLLPTLKKDIPKHGYEVSHVFSRSNPKVSRIVIRDHTCRTVTTQVSGAIPRSSVVNVLLRSRVGPAFIGTSTVDVLRRVKSD